MRIPQTAIGNLLARLPELRKAFGKWPTYCLLMVALLTPFWLGLFAFLAARK
jgi:hypothetical protein